ncbi:hypothetical protein EFD56_30380 [Rhizobium phaseoli]|nr:hypothetical protein EFD56_30380 [Rhizobium phaseoli]
MNLLARLLRAWHYLATVQPSLGITEGRSGRAGRDEATAAVAEQAASAVRLAIKPTTLSVIPGLTLGSTSKNSASISLQCNSFTDPA